MKNHYRKKHQKTDVYKIPNKIILSPTKNESLDKNKNTNISEEITENNKQSKIDIGHLIDKIFSEDFLLIGLIAILIFEVMNLKKENTDKNIIFEYELMIAALIYIYF